MLKLAFLPIKLPSINFTPLKLLYRFRMTFNACFHAPIPRKGVPKNYISIFEINIFFSINSIQKFSFSSKVVLPRTALERIPACVFSLFVNLVCPHIIDISPSNKRSVCIKTACIDIYPITDWSGLKHAVLGGINYQGNTKQNPFFPPATMGRLARFSEDFFFGKIFGGNIW